MKLGGQWHLQFSVPFVTRRTRLALLPGMKIREESDAFVIQGRFGNRVDLPPFSLLKLLDRDNRKQKHTLSILWLAELHEILYALN